MLWQPCSAQSAVNYAYSFGGWSNPGCGKQQSRTESESCGAASGCTCSNKRSVMTETRAGPCCAVNYAYSFGGWSNPGCGKQQSRTESESCGAASGCTCSNKRSVKTETRAGCTTSSSTTTTTTGVSSSATTPIVTTNSATPPDASTVTTIAAKPTAPGAAAQLPPPVLSPSLGAATTVVYSTAVETGDVIYVADGNGNPSTATGSSSSSSNAQTHYEGNYGGDEAHYEGSGAGAGGGSSHTNSDYAEVDEAPNDGQGGEYDEVQSSYAGLEGMQQMYASSQTGGSTVAAGSA
eukprot:gene11785-24897_t